MSQAEDVGVETHGHVAVVEIRRPPHNFFDVGLITALAEAFEDIDRQTELRAIVLAAQGSSFCAGADFSRPSPTGGATGDLYGAAARLFATKKPIIGAIQGPAIGGGLGLALVPDFRIVAPEARFAANFVKLGIHPGFGLTLTLPRLIGLQKAAQLLYTGRRINGEEALAWGLADGIAPKEGLREAALALASEIAEAAPLAVIATRATLRDGLVEAFKARTDHEGAEQAKLFSTQDYREGVRSVAERRPGNFVGA
ncbi:MAG TPA: enoyl-CoA hydratase/isomerase family protein [Phenylobacterium sp.]|nr:enoyl-CoA hydratase/isomerase family protein [Phenylobacterium sp.]